MCLRNLRSGYPTTQSFYGLVWYGSVWSFGGPEVVRYLSRHMAVVIEKRLTSSTRFVSSFTFVFHLQTFFKLSQAFVHRTFDMTQKDICSKPIGAVYISYRAPCSGRSFGMISLLLINCLITLYYTGSFSFCTSVQATMSDPPIYKHFRLNAHCFLCREDTLKDSDVPWRNFDEIACCK